jgi:hypothetical protein
VVGDGGKGDSKAESMAHTETSPPLSSCGMTCCPAAIASSWSPGGDSCSWGYHLCLAGGEAGIGL